MYLDTSLQTAVLCCVGGFIISLFIAMTTVLMEDEKGQKIGLKIAGCIAFIYLVLLSFSCFGIFHFTK